MIRVEKFSKESWEKFSENAHKICFATVKPASQDRIDFALMAIRDDKPMGYITCRENDSETLYWQFGGAFPGTRETSLSWQAYQAFTDFCKSRYARITTLIENENVVMLKMAMKIGFRITGVRLYRGQVLVENTLVFK